MRLDEFYDLQEDRTNSIGIIFGRWNPPHRGHIAAWKMMADENEEWLIGTHPGTHNKKNPLPLDVKLSVIDSIAPFTRGHVIPEQDWFVLATKAYQMMPDSELRVYTDEQWAMDGIVKYNGVEGKHGFYQFKAIVPVQTPRLSSATQLRQAVADNNVEEFYRTAGVDHDTEINGVHYFDLVKQHLDVYNESLEETGGLVGVMSRAFNHKDRNQYPRAARMYKQLASDLKNADRHPLNIATEVSKTFGFESIRDFVNYLTTAKNHHIDPELLPDRRVIKRKWYEDKETVTRSERKKRDR